MDAISSFAGIPIDIRAENIGFMMSTSNKCIQGMAGVSFVICRKNELNRSANWPQRSFYLNLYQQYQYFEKHGEMQFTPPVQVIYALKQAIKEYFKEGKEERYQRYADNWRVLTQGLKEFGFQLLLKEDLHSKILTAVLEPTHKCYDFNVMHDLLYDKGFTIYPGKIGNLNTFRISNMGAIDHHDIEDFLDAFAQVMAIMGLKGELYLTEDDSLN